MNCIGVRVNFAGLVDGVARTDGVSQWKLLGKEVSNRIRQQPTAAGDADDEQPPTSLRDTEIGRVNLIEGDCVSDRPAATHEQAQPNVFADTGNIFDNPCARHELSDESPDLVNQVVARVITIPGSKSAERLARRTSLEERQRASLEAQRDTKRMGIDLGDICFEQCDIGVVGSVRGGRIAVEFDRPEDSVPSSSKAFSGPTGSRKEVDSGQC